MNIKNNKKIHIIEIGIIITLVIVFVVINVMINRKNNKKETEGYQYCIDSLVYHHENDEVEIAGWCIKEEVDCATTASRQGFKVFLAEDGDIERAIEIPVLACIRKDVTDVYGSDENDYTYCGFYGSVKVDPVVLNKRYQIIIQYDNSVEKYLYTSKYLNKGTATTEIEQPLY